MSTITLKKLDHGVCRLVIDSGKGNPLTPAFVNDLNHHLLGLSSSPPRALIIDTDGASIFGGGFALPIIASWKREELWAFFNRFMEGVHRILHLACPTITVVDGHAIAGGFIFSLASDFRVVRNEGIKLGLSEVDLGVAVPADARALLEERTSPSDALWLSATGELISPQRALEIKYATMLSEQPLTQALDLANTLAQKPGSGTAMTTVLANRRISERMRTESNLGKDIFLDTWFSEEGQQGIQTLAQKLSGRNSQKEG